MEIYPDCNRHHHNTKSVTPADNSMVKWCLGGRGIWLGMVDILRHLTTHYLDIARIMVINRPVKDP